MKKRLPFWIWPYSWGLSGKARDIAQAEYELTGLERDLRVHELRRDEYRPREYEELRLELMRKYDAISDEGYRRGIADMIDDTLSRTLAHLEIDRDVGKLTDTEYEKAAATARDEPWVTVVRMDFSEGSALEGSFELDWNDQFVDKLQAEGYTGPTPDHIVNTWFMEVCKNIATEEYAGTGNFQADAEHNLETMKRWHQSPVDAHRSSYT